MAQSDHPIALLIEPDLFFAARLLSVLKNLGFETERAATADEALGLLTSSPARIAVVNLGNPRLGGLALVRDIKALPHPPRVLAYMPHVRIAEARAEALKAGVDKLCPNSAVTSRLPLIVDALLRGEASTPEVDEAE